MMLNDNLRSALLQAAKDRLQVPNAVIEDATLDVSEEDERTRFTLKVVTPMGMYGNVAVLTRRMEGTSPVLLAELIDKLTSKTREDVYEKWLSQTAQTA